MSVQATWMRAEMLGSPRQGERKLTEAELRVQKSLQKMSIPDWYLNKRTDPPRILTNDTPIESRPPSWKNGTYKKKSAECNTYKNMTGTYKVGKNENKAPNKQNQATFTYKVSKKEKIDTDNRKDVLPNDEIFDLNIPKIKFTGNISKTFPKVSPSRKIQNINIVFPQKKEKASELLHSPKKQVDKYRTFVKRSCPSPKSKETASSEEEITSPVSTLTRKTSRLNISRDSSFNTSHCFIATENSDDESKSPDSTLTERAESPRGKYSVSLTWNWSRDNARISEDIFSESEQNLQHCSSLMGNHSERDIDSSCTNDSLRTPNSKAVFTMPAASTPNRKQSAIFSSTLIEDTPIRRQSMFPRFLADELEIQDEEPEEEVPRRRQSIVSKPLPIQRTKKILDPTGELGSQPSPNTRFFHSRKKSTELENIVKTSKGSGGSMVKDIVQELNKRLVPMPNPAPRRRSANQQTFVKNLVLALENGCKETAQEILATKRRAEQEEDMDSVGSCNDSAASSTTISIKDSDSDSDLISPCPTMGNGSYFQFDQSAKHTVGREDDSVYWIPVPRCKLPRTSSLLSMMSRLGTHQSPCVSPIRATDSCKSCYGDTWGSGKVAGNMARPLFRIEESTVMDSGFSDRSDGSDRSGASSGEFSTSSSLDISRHSQRRKSIVDQQTFER